MVCFFQMVGKGLRSLLCPWSRPPRFLALVCLLREEVFEKQGLIEYNFHCFRDAIQEVFDIRRKALMSPNTAPVGEDLA